MTLINKSLKIAMLHYSAPPVVGGVEMVMQHHARLLAQTGHSVTIFAGKGESVEPGILLEKNLLFSTSSPEILSIKKKLDQGLIPASFLKVKDELLNFLRKQVVSYDVMIAHNICSLHKNLPLSAALHEFIQEKESPPLIAWHHDLAWRNTQYRKELHDQWPWDLLKKIWHPDWQVHVAVSEMRQIELSRLFNLPAESISVIPSGLDWKRFLAIGDQTEEIILRHDLLNAHPLFLLPVRITRRKNIELAIQIMDSLAHAFPNAGLVVTGPPGPHNPGNASYLDELIKMTNKLGLGSELNDTKKKPRVIFLAETDNRYLPDEVIADLFRFCDALLIPSAQEGFGIPILEAGLAGLPIFCSDIQPFRETAGELAVFFDLNEKPRDIAAKIIDYVERDKRIDLKARIRNKYTWNQILRKQIEPILLIAVKIANKKKKENE